MDPVRVEASSFRDPRGTVMHRGGRVLRGLDPEGAEDWRALKATRAFSQLVARGALVDTWEAPADVVAEADLGHWALVLEHEPIPVVSYPYEWTFEMLRAAAVLHLEVLLAALEEGMTLKDGYAYNVQFRGAQPVFIDLGSFTPVGEGGPWVGYRQFCQTLLYPLLLQAHLDIPFQRYLLGQLEGIPASDMRRFLSGRHAFQKGVLRHVVLHDVLSSRLTEGAEATRQDLADASDGAELSRIAAGKLLDLVRSLKSKRSTSGWADYRTTCSYSDEDTRAKEEFVDEHLARLSPGLVWDLGCNDGAFARRAARHADQVVAADSDDVVVDAFFRSLGQPGAPDNILPLVLDLTDPSPDRGWRNQERSAFLSRSRPDLILALALVHHLSIAANIPLAQVLDWFQGLDAPLLVEFVERHDPMADRLLANKPPGIHDEYRTDVFESLLEERFEVEGRTELPSGSRRLYLARPRR
ncbi:MAG: methyltransferase [Iamia sp.]